MLLDYSSKHLRFLLWSMLVTLLPRLSPAQQLPLSKDYFITATGDTLRGQLQFSQLVTDYGVTLLPADGGPRRTYRATESRGFGMADGRRFVVQRIKLINNLPVPARPTDDAQNLLPVFLQHLVQGKANLYRLDYNANHAETGPMEYLRYETTFFYVQVPGSNLLLLQQTSFSAVLKGLFRDCPPAQKAVSHTRFDENGLAQLVLGYNAACGAGGAAADLRRSVGAHERLVVGLRAGVFPGLVNYPQSQSLSDKTVGWGSNFTVGVSLITGRRLGLATGLYYTARRSSGTTTQVVPPGFANPGEVLTLDQHVAVGTLQAPLLLRYSFAKPRLRPFLAAGAVVGYTISNTTTQTVPVSVYDPRYFVSVQGTQVVSARNLGISRGPLLGVQAGGGIQPRLGAHTLVLEAYFEKGNELSSNEIAGRLSYVGALVRVGIDF